MLKAQRENAGTWFKAHGAKRGNELKAERGV
jgi:hypothetical protein